MKVPFGTRCRLNVLTTYYMTFIREQTKFSFLNFRNLNKTSICQCIKEIMTLFHNAVQLFNN